MVGIVVHLSGYQLHSDEVEREYDSHARQARGDTKCALRIGAFNNNH